jgi:hypothetical protein
VGRIKNANGRRERVAFTSCAPLPFAPKTLERAGSNVDADCFIMALHIASRARRPLLVRSVRIDDDAEGCEVDHVRNVRATAASICATFARVIPNI